MKNNKSYPDILEKAHRFSLNQSQHFLGQLGVDQWSDLLFVEKKLLSITNSIFEVDIIKGQQLTPQKLKSYSDKGGLKKVDALHFAVHAVSFPTIPERSALVLYRAFPNAFLIAGSRNVISTLWLVYDQYTMLFVQEFYKQLAMHSIPEALMITKRKCISGKLGEALQKAIYWGAFVLWGAINIEPIAIKK